MSEEFVPSEKLTDDSGTVEPTPSGDNPEGAEYTLEALAKKAQHADTHISRLEEENAKMRDILAAMDEKLQKAAKVEDLLQKPQDAGPSTPKEEPVKPAEIDLEKLAGEIEGRLTAKQLKEKQDANLAAAQDALVKAYGKEANNKVVEVAQENGLSVEDLLQYAKTTPKVFNKLFPELSTPAQKMSNKSGYNTMSLKGKPGENKPTGYWNARNTKSQLDAIEDMARRMGL